MAFIKDKATSANAAIMSSSDIVAALVTAGKVTTVAKAVEAAETLFDAFLVKAGEVVDADNEAFAAADTRGGGDDEKPARKSSGSSSKSSTSKGKGSSKRAITAEDAATLELNSGPFKGLTMGEVMDLDEEAAEEYEYDKGTGADYIGWLATSRNPNDFTRARAKALVAADED